MVERNASDLHIRASRPPLIRIKGALQPIENAPPFKPEEVDSIAAAMMSEKQKRKFEEEQSIDLAYSVPGLMRFRVNVFRQRGTTSAVFRNIALHIPNAEEMGLPTVLYTFCNKPQGLILVTGPTGSGKSTTLATLVRQINETRNVHIVTIEDPIEFLFTDQKASMSQREVGIDTPSFGLALKNALRQDPDVVLLGEMRDLETISTVMMAADTGHLVFSTLHTNNALQTISRIIDVFPPEQQDQIRLQLSNVLVGIVSQRLVPRLDGNGRIAAVEILINSPSIKNLINENKINEITEQMEKSVSYYRMQTLEQSLIALIANKKIALEDALAASIRPDDLRLMLSQSGFDEQGNCLSIQESNMHSSSPGNEINHSDDDSSYFM
ncbi:MAG: type IV pilus twitching motility protein PilT [Deltaproteobacteria bacterium]|nr:type IV pilus twitching motility protein PilT [Deltaproteobacteria bacterium]